MIKLRTKTEFSIPTKRGVIQGIVRLIIDKMEIDINNVIPKGYYYHLDENGQPIKLDEISSNTVLTWGIIEQTENELLEPLESPDNLKINLIQRLKEFTFLQLALENGKNYGTVYTDWELDND